MKITIATGPLLPVPALQGGAIPRLWQGLAEEFVRAGHEVMIFARAFPGQPAEESIQGVRYLRWGGFEQSLSIKADLLKDFFYSVGSVRRLPRADILITNVFWLPVLAGWMRGRTGRIVVNANRFPKRQYALYSKASRIAAASTAIRDAIIAQTPSMADRTRVYPNPINLDLLKPPTSSSKNGSTKTLLFTGRLHPEKGVHVLIEAFARVSGKHSAWRLRLVGPIAENQGGGGSEYAQRLHSLAGGLPVEFVGPIFDPQQLAEVYRGGDLFCYPSLAEKGESFGVAPLEAMATGMMPIVSSLDCFRDFITDQETGLFFNHRAADSIQELANRLDQAMENPELREAMGKRSEAAARNFGYAQVAKAYLDDFQELLDRGQA